MERAIAASKEEEAKTRALALANTQYDVEDPAIQALVTKAINNEKTPPRKHHVVPASYLRRWTEAKQLRVTNVDEVNSWTCAPEKAARITDFYSMASDDLDPAVVPPLFAETQLSEIEELGKHAIDEFLQYGLSSRSSTSKDSLAIFLGFQHVRGTGTRERSQAITREQFKMQYGDLSDEKLSELAQKSSVPPSPEQLAESKRFIAGIQDGSMEIRQQTAAAVSLSFSMALPVAEELSKRHWVILRTPHMLLTCDEPVVPIGGPGTSRGMQSGVGEAWVVVFALEPGALLVMFKHPPRRHWLRDLTTAETVEINHEILAHSHKLAFEKASRRMSAALKVPRLSSLLEITEHPVEGESARSLLRFYTPSRWKDSDAPPPWPVERWYR